MNLHKTQTEDSDYHDKRNLSVLLLTKSTYYTAYIATGNEDFWNTTALSARALHTGNTLAVVIVTSTRHFDVQSGERQFSKFCLKSRVMPQPEEPIYCSQQINIPPELPDILKQFTKAAIRTQPKDVLQWAYA